MLYPCTLPSVGKSRRYLSGKLIFYSYIGFARKNPVLPKKLRKFSNWPVVAFS